MDAKTPSPAGPIADRRPQTVTHHGIEKTDDYAWLRADNWQEVMRDPSQLASDIRAHLEAENTATKAALRDTAKLQETLFAEMKGRIKEDDTAVPAPDGPFEYYTRYRTGGQHPIYARKPRGDDAEEILIDGDALAEGHDYFRIGNVTHSPDHARIAYATDTTGSEYFSVFILDPATGEVAETGIADTNASMEWAADSRTLLYVRLDENHRPHRIIRRKADGSDAILYEEDDAGRFVGLGSTQSRRFLLVSSHDHQTSEISLLDAVSPGAPPQLVAAAETEHEYSVEHHSDRLIILTNSDGAEDFRIVETEVAAPGRENWREIVAHKPGRLILDIAVFADHFVRLEREDGLPRIVVRRFSDGEEHTIAYDEEAYGLSMSAGYEFDTTTLRFTYSSPKTPAQVFDYDMETRTRTLRKTQEVPSGHDPSAYVTRRIFAPASDGEMVPVTILHRADAARDGSAPLLLYGYGSYGMAMPAGFSTNILSLVDRGFVFAIAHIRGGKEKGYRWYKDGRRDRKTNTFKDFIAAGEYLAAEGYTARGRIVGHGGSAGGMLMGAVANMAPHLFLGIVAEVPFVDVLNTMLDNTLPLTPPEWPEWGNPIESADAYRTIASYSPYDNVAAQPYPHIFALGGIADPRVTYWEPAKWVAKLRELKTDDNLLLLKTNMSAGHGGASGRFERLKEVAEVYGFALKVTGRAGSPDGAKGNPGT